ncbi:MAG: GGDEF domain-containing protein, partial [Candidatus Aminicenantes bacterium]|nr:GGDEF domain-containing protein [Candidatus Aminicenantes bacterium]
NFNKIFDFCRKRKYFMGMIDSRLAQPPLQGPEILALKHLFEKNHWLIRIRMFYPVFIMLFFLSYNFLAGSSLISWQNALLVFLLPVIVNLLFYLDVRQKEKSTERQVSYDQLLSSISRQLFFDLVAIALIVFFSGGLDSPIIAMFIVYIMIATFLTDYHMAFRITLTVIVLLLLITVLQKGETFFYSQQIMAMLTFDIMFIFTYFVSGYLSKNLHTNEALLKELLKQTQELSISDGLTGLYNQMHFFELIKMETKKAQRHSQSYALIMFDVDYFKNFNDHNGHQRGSETLKDIGAIMKSKFRTSDLLAKYGGDEFVIILPHTDKVGAYLAAERLRESVEKHVFPGAEFQPQKKLTISLGLAAFPEHGLNEEEILNRADKALYFAKESGRNRTVIYNENIGKELE